MLWSNLFHVTADSITYVAEMWLLTWHPCHRRRGSAGMALEVVLTSYVSVWIGFWLSRAELSPLGRPSRLSQRRWLLNDIITTSADVIS
ncbi:hypothetical protein LIER_13822 [Lithospermum erythrorhizon]|uniref:Uncharacterized protein n=1 Tax=Lithospermum erythrorhizon TaxID=34254 RepID=A0AAV3PYT7_LITER